MMICCAHVARSSHRSFLSLLSFHLQEEKFTLYFNQLTHALKVWRPFGLAGCLDWHRTLPASCCHQPPTPQWLLPRPEWPAASRLVPVPPPPPVAAAAAVVQELARVTGSLQPREQLVPLLQPHLDDLHEKMLVGGQPVPGAAATPALRLHAGRHPFRRRWQLVVRRELCGTGFALPRAATRITCVCVRACARARLRACLPACRPSWLCGAACPLPSPPPQPGLHVLTWTSMNIDGYLHRFHQVRAVLCCAVLCCAGCMLCCAARWVCWGCWLRGSRPMPLPPRRTLRGGVAPRGSSCCARYAPPARPAVPGPHRGAGPQSGRHHGKSHTGDAQACLRACACVPVCLCVVCVCGGGDVPACMLARSRACLGACVCASLGAPGCV